MKKTILCALLGMLLTLNVNAQHGLYYCFIPQSPDVGYSITDYPGCSDTVSCGTYGLRNMDWVFDPILHPDPATWPTSSPVTKFVITFFATDQSGNAYTGQPFTLPTKLTFDGHEYYQNVTYGDSAIVTLVMAADILPPWQNQKMVNLKTVLASLPSDVYRIRARIDAHSTVYGVDSGQGMWIYNIDAFDAACTLPSEYVAPGTDSVDIELDNVSLFNNAPDTSMQPALLTKVTVLANAMVNGQISPLPGPYYLIRSGGDTIPILESRIDSLSGAVDLIVNYQNSAEHLEFIPVSESRPIGIQTKVLPLEGTVITIQVRAEARIYGSGWQANDIPTSPPPTFTVGRTITFGSQPTGIAETTTKELSMYPNPATEVVTIKTDKPAQVQLFDINGKMITSEQSTGSITLSVSNVPAGLYAARILIKDEAIVTKKIVVMAH
jgi:hypothetical protein